MDGLLLDSETLALAAFLQSCMHLGLGERREHYLRCVGSNVHHSRQEKRFGR
jgi:beta-phosphoglucomutase-like phosphatase (HAD superfamily)